MTQSENEILSSRNFDRHFDSLKILQLMSQVNCVGVQNKKMLGMIIFAVLSSLNLLMIL